LTDEGGRSVAALGVAAPVLLVPIGLAIWVLGEAL
jgi:hypothetical protein